MIKTTGKSKKSTSKKRNFKISPLIPIIALIEVIVLVVITSYAWYFVQASKVIGSGTISVAADSGLDIDFQYSNVDDYINIWNYVGQDFKFEPATSLDGRNIYFPTSGTFNNDETEKIIFRDGTVNDINSKYLSIDFELTNTSGTDQHVYLNNNSFFTVKKDNTRQESRALRLAFYQNDGNSGNVGSSLLRSNSASDGGNISTDSEGADSNAFTVYFDNDYNNTNWGAVYAYYWNSHDNTNSPALTSWPGTEMARVSGKVYSLTIDNPTITSGGQTYLKYDRVIFNNNHNQQTATINLTSAENGKIFNKSHSGSSQGSAYQEDTVYFLKPSGWNSDANNDGIADVYCHAWTTSGNTHSYTTWPGDRMTYVGSGIYSYTYNNNNTGGFLFDDGSGGGTHQTADVTIDANTPGSVYYCDGQVDGDGKYLVQRYTGNKYADMHYNTIYLFNTFGWDKPYATVSTSAGNDASVTDTEIAMVALSGNMYYCTVPEIFSYVYFHKKGSTSSTNRTIKAAIDDQRVFRPNSTLQGVGYAFDTFFSYSKYIKEEGYPVISPGVSAGFQRPYSPVITIGAESGLAEDIVPAYSNSIDNYILGSGTPLFTLKANHMVSLSMIMWLEGTDEACVGDLYPANTIDFKLEFSTLYYEEVQGATEERIVNPGDSASYTYRFYDKTREIWTANRQSTESGVTVAPVMQLYDNTIKRGYLMKPAAYGSYDGDRKVSCWEVDAPQSIANYGHDIIFRRVNPYDEDEVWNYWHAGPVAGARAKTNGVYNTYTSPQKPYDIAFTSVENGNSIISFTAFADGSPLSTMSGLSGDIDSVYCVPDDSCGGLWGNHTVRTVTVFDGLRGQPLKDNEGVLTVNYKYTYKSDDYTPEVKIEYKASGPGYNCFYYLIMPEVAYANQTPCAIKRYRNFNSGFAINSAENNPNITFVDYYGEDSVIAGDYFELNEMTSGDDYSYWGSDMLYVQTTGENSVGYSQSCIYTSSSANDNNAKLFQVHFYYDNDDEHGRWAFLYPNSEFVDSTGGSGYACVVPNDRVYTSYRLENCSYNGDTKYNVSPKQTVSQAANLRISDTVLGHSVDLITNYLGENGITAESIRVKIGLQTTNVNMNQTGNDPQCHNFSDSYGSTSNWPGHLMTYEGTVDNIMKKYWVVLDNVSKFPKIQFSYWGGSGDNKSQVVTLNMNTVKNYMLYESKYTKTVGLLNTSGTTNETIKSDSHWTAAQWPHLSFNG